MPTRTRRPPPRHRIPEPVPLPVPPPDYEPTEAELAEEFDMPGLTLDQARERFFRPFRFVQSDKS